ncbi:MAG: reverse transcriptase-like protein, partial [Candidatus Thorarchaeota archaeon]
FVQKNEILCKESNFLGKTTNNVAEYQAIIKGLKAAEKYYKGIIHLFSDSNLAIQQINNNWKVNYPHLLALKNEIYQLCKKFKKTQFFHIGRNNKYIQICDKMCNEQLDAKEFKLN